VSLEIARGGKTEEVSAERVRNQSPVATHDLPGDTFRLLSLEVAYVKLSAIKAADLPAYFERAKDTKGLIVDIRNYPSAFMPFVMGAYLATKPTAFVSFTLPDTANPGAFWFTSGPLIEPGLNHHAGKVFILVEENSQSRVPISGLCGSDLLRTRSAFLRTDYLQSCRFPSEWATRGANSGQQANHLYFGESSQSHRDRRDCAKRRTPCICWLSAA
jgi:hypothetical protein